MKPKLILIFLSLLFANATFAADTSWLGGKTQLTPTTFHTDTNFFVTVSGSSTGAVVRNISPSNVIAKIQAVGLAKTTNFPAGKLVYVDSVHGSDTTGNRTNAMRPFQSITAAKNAAQSGDTIWVGPGTYNEFSLLKNGVNYFLQPGCKITNYTANARGGYGIFDDRTNGPVTCSIWGAGDIVIGGDPFATNFGGAFVTTNRLTQLNVKLNSIHGSWPGGPANQGFAALHLKDGTNAFRIDTIDSDNFNDLVAEAGSEGFNGIFWEDGEHYVDVRFMRVDGYCYWGEEPDRLATNNIYLTGEKWYSASAALYHDAVGGSPSSGAGWKSWVAIKEINGSVSTYNGGKQYVVCEKLNAASLAAEVAGSSGFPEQWLWAQKIESAGNYAIGGTRGNQWVFCSHIIYTGTGAAMLFTGGTNFISGQYLQVSAGRGLDHRGGETRIQGIEIDSRGVTSSITNVPVHVSGSGLALKGVSIRSSSIISNAITASSAQTVSIEGLLSSDRTNSANITLGGTSTNYTGALVVNGSLSVLGTMDASTITATNNIFYTYSTSDFVATNSTVNSNLTVNFQTTGTREIYLTNNISITNFTGYSNGQNAVVKWKLIPQLVNRTVVWPTIGAPSFAISLGTNQGSTLWTTLTNGVTYQLSFDSWNTNIDATISAFYR